MRAKFGYKIHFSKRNEKNIFRASFCKDLLRDNRVSRTNILSLQHDRESYMMIHGIMYDDL